MRRARRDDTEDFLAAAGEDFDALGEQVVFPPAADGHKLEESIRCDVLDEEADFIHVAGEQHARSRARGLTEHRAVLVGGELATVFKFIHEDRPDFIFMTGDRVGIGQFL
jgi:hypothetical protein